MSTSDACEVKFTPNLNAYEELVGETAQLEVLILTLESTSRGRALRTAQDLHGDLDIYIELLLAAQPDVARASSDLAALAERYQILFNQNNPTSTQAEAKTVLQLMSAPEEVLAATVISTGNAGSHVLTVEFDPDVLLDFRELPLRMQSKFLRAIFTGVVGPVGESGIKYLSEVHRQLVEVKTYAGGARLLGCLKAGKVKVLKYLPDHFHSDAGMLRYRGLCG